jgi:hypothetical protein
MMDMDALVKRGAEIRMAELELERQGLLSLLNGGGFPEPLAEESEKKHTRSAAARKRMSEAQKARWKVKRAAMKKPPTPREG